eukprot:augustus_masked-scaffold_36-processed-gene-2.17-mRNA-1 protein AED:1.00 eAED:1.00 QI:0/0/0/0/1/1/2/0/559
MEKRAVNVLMESRIKAAINRFRYAPPTLPEKRRDKKGWRKFYWEKSTSLNSTSSSEAVLGRIVSRDEKLKVVNEDKRKRHVLEKTGSMESSNTFSVLSKSTSENAHDDSASFGDSVRSESNAQSLISQSKSKRQGSVEKYFSSKSTFPRASKFSSENSLRKTVSNTLATRTNSLDIDSKTTDFQSEKRTMKESCSFSLEGNVPDPSELIRVNGNFYSCLSLESLKCELDRLKARLENPRPLVELRTDQETEDTSSNPADVQKTYSIISEQSNEIVRVIYSSSIRECHESTLNAIEKVQQFDEKLSLYEKFSKRQKKVEIQYIDQEALKLILYTVTKKVDTKDEHSFGLDAVLKDFKSSSTLSKENKYTFSDLVDLYTQMSRPEMNVNHSQNLPCSVGTQFHNIRYNKGTSTIDEYSRNAQTELLKGICRSCRNCCTQEANIPKHYAEATAPFSQSIETQNDLISTALLTAEAESKFYREKYEKLKEIVKTNELKLKENQKPIIGGTKPLSNPGSGEFAEHWKELKKIKTHMERLKSERLEREGRMQEALASLTTSTLSP